MIKRNYFSAVERHKRQYKYLYQKMLDKNIILRAYYNLKRGKTKRKEIKYIDVHLEEEVLKMQEMIYYTRPEFENTPYEHLGFHSTTTKPKFIMEHRKKRKIFMPEIHEQWLHHIIVLLLKPIILNRSYPYSCGSMPGRGAHYAKKYLERKIRQNKGQHCLKADIRHFYNNINKNNLFLVLSYRIKDNWFIYVLKRCLINFKKGLPLGFYISQWLANFYLEDLDRYILLMGCTAYVRYMDDIVVYDNNKYHLRNMKYRIARYLCKYRKIKLKDNWQVFKITDKRPIDFMGFKFYPNKTTIRKNIMLGATRIARRISNEKFRTNRFYVGKMRALLSYLGWFKYSNTKYCFWKYIGNNINIGKIKRIVSNYDKSQRRLLAT